MGRALCAWYLSGRRGVVQRTDRTSGSRHAFPPFSRTGRARQWVAGARDRGGGAAAPTGGLYNAITGTDGRCGAATSSSRRAVAERGGAAAEVLQQDAGRAELPEDEGEVVEVAQAAAQPQPVWAMESFILAYTKTRAIVCIL